MKKTNKNYAFIDGSFNPATKVYGWGGFLVDQFEKKKHIIQGNGDDPRMAKMMVILCDSFDDVKLCFAVFMDYLETFEEETISKVFEYSYCVETDDKIRYIFVDYRFEKLFLNMNLNNVDILRSDEFFDRLYDFYEYKEYYWIDYREG